MARLLWQKINDWINDNIVYRFFARVYWNFSIVDKSNGRPIVLRSRLPNGRFIRYLAEKYQLKSVLSLEDDYDEDMNKWLDEYGIRHITVLNHCSAKTIFEDADDFKLYWQLVNNEELQPMLIRCRGGADRTGAAVAAYRVLSQHWPKWKAWFEMLTFFHNPIKYKQPSRFLFGDLEELEIYAELTGKMRKK